jgi:hypothetical protein
MGSVIAGAGLGGADPYVVFAVFVVIGPKLVGSGLQTLLA